MTVSLRPERAEVTVRDPMGTPLGQMLEPYRAQLTPFLWEGITLEKVAVQLLLASRKVPDLVKCDPPVLVDAVCRALEYGGNIGQDVHLVPFKNKAGALEPTLMLDYKFKVALVVAAGGARSIDAHCVWSDETFDIQLGSEPRITHRPAMSPDPKRTLLGAYAVAHLSQRVPPMIKWMSITEIEAVRKGSRQWGPNSNPPVLVCPPWYAIKTVVHRVVKLLPKNPKLAQLYARFEREEGAEFGDPTDADARPAHVTPDGEDLSFAPPDASFPEPSRPAASAPAPEEPSPDIAWALAYQVPFGDDKGKPLGQLTSVSYLRAIRDWAKKQAALGERGFHGAQELDSAATIAMEVLKRRQEAAA